MADRPLAGCRVLVTRPAHQAGPLSEAIEARGGEAIRFPTIEIGPPTEGSGWEQVASELAGFDWLIFASANAVTGFEGHCRVAGRGWPTGPRYAAIGRKTAAVLHERAGVDARVPPDFRSESFLDLPEMAAEAVQGQRILLVSGEGGRRLLPETLTERGAAVTRLPVYARRLPDTDPTPVENDLAAGRLDAAVVTSPEGFTNLLAMLGTAAASALAAVPLVAISGVTAEAIRAHAFPDPTVAPEASDEGLLQALTGLCLAPLTAS